MEIAQRIMDSPAPGPEKLQADFFLLREDIQRAIRQAQTRLAAATAPRHRPAEQERLAAVHREEIAAFLKRYQATSALPRSVAYGVILADLAKLADLKEELLDRLEKDFGQMEELAPFLRHYGRGRFSAHLTRLDGTKLVVPDNVEGTGNCHRLLGHLVRSVRGRGAANEAASTSSSTRAVWSSWE